MSLRQGSPMQRAVRDLGRYRPEHERSERDPGRRAMLTSRKLWKTAALAFPLVFVAQWLLLFAGAVALEKIGFVMEGVATQAVFFLAGVAALLLAVLRKHWGTITRAVVLSAGVSAILIAAQLTEL